jgi:hypothetical protein
MSVRSADNSIFLPHPLSSTLEAVLTSGNDGAGLAMVNVGAIGCASVASVGAVACASVASVGAVTCASENINGGVATAGCLTFGSNAFPAGQIIGAGLVTAQAGSITGRLDVANGAGIQQGLYLSGVRVVMPFVQQGDIPATDPAAPLSCSPVGFDIFTLGSLPIAGRYLASATCRIVPVDPVGFPINRVRLGLFAGAGEFDNPSTEIALTTDTLGAYTATITALVSFDGTEQFKVNLLVNSILGAGVTYLIDSPSICSIVYISA